jgi:hypothetical protein
MATAHRTFIAGPPRGWVWCLSLYLLLVRSLDFRPRSAYTIGSFALEGEWP